MATDKDIAMHTKIEGKLRRKLSCAEGEAAALRAQVAALVAALKPFANYFGGKIENGGSGTIVAPQFAIQCFRDAYAAIAAAEGSAE